MNEQRTVEQLRRDYEIERELSNRLRNASKNERRRLYSSVYDEFFSRVPLTPQLVRKSSGGDASAFVLDQMKILKDFLKADTVFLEVGPGDCTLSLEVARSVKQVYAVDVSSEISNNPRVPTNFHFVLSDGCTIPVPPDSVDVAFSNQLMEHLHPDDAIEQLNNIVGSLIPGGVYICCTPNRINGPHDISKYFDTSASGFHLKEYLISELRILFQNAGFSRVEVMFGARGMYLRTPPFMLEWFEALLIKLPYRLRLWIALTRVCSVLLGITMIGTK